MRGEKMRIRISVLVLSLSLIPFFLTKICKGEEVKMGEKKVLMVIAQKDFRDEEYKYPREILEEGGIKVVVASSKLGTAYGSYGLTANVDLLLDEVNPQEYEAIIFVGGMGSSEYFDNPKAHFLAQELFKKGKLVCAICIAPNTLAQAGILKGKKATAYPSVKEEMVKQGAIFTGKDVEVDGNIITANGPHAAKDFGKIILEKLQK
ncbi:MAG: DJ-1 family protein [Candidatus Omnitrophota bacterium]|nr:MAG: DJ-1 family protein [Candidatus Omnitrophota bacterium]